MDFQMFKEIAQTWFLKAGQFFLFQNILMYFFACVIAHEPIGLTGYIGFLNHCCQWVGR